MPSFPFRVRALSAFALAVPFVMLSCQKILGDYEIIQSAPVAPGDNTVACAPGTFRCAGLWLYACSASGDNWTEMGACDNADLCDSSVGRCRACVAGQRRCNGANLEACNADESGWEAVQTCASPNDCNLNSDSCRPCTVGEYQCNGASLQTCSPEQTWVENQACATASACVVGPDKRSGSCRQATCEPNRYRCNGGQLLRCDPHGIGEVEVANCRDRALCSETNATAAASMGLLATCSLGCVEGVVRCDDANIEICQGNDWILQETCPSADQCSTSGCRPCTDGEVECNANRLRSCSGGHWEGIHNCESHALCDAANVRCIDPTCPVPGQVACLPDGLSRCSLDQTDWQVLDFCGSDALCNENDQKCETPICERDARRCVGNEYQFCNDSRTAWEAGQECPAGQLCDLTMVCADGGCQAGAFRCNDVYLEQCDGTAWNHVDRCATAKLCDAGAGVCNPPICGGALPSFNCLGQSLQECSPDRDVWLDFDTCLDTEECDAVNGVCR